MTFKTLKHRTLPDTFGIIDEHHVIKGESMIYQWTIPLLYAADTTYDQLVRYWAKKSAHVTHQLADYELVTVEVAIL